MRRRIVRRRRRGPHYVGVRNAGGAILYGIALIVLVLYTFVIDVLDSPAIDRIYAELVVMPKFDCTQSSSIPIMP